MSRVIFICLALCLELNYICLADIPIGYESYIRWSELPQLRLGVNMGMASSYDRTGYNTDWNYYEWPEGYITTETVCTVKTIQGPGIIYRFWMPHCMSSDGYVVRMYFDGETTPRIDTMSDTLLDGYFSYFDSPMVATCAGGQFCYEPIPFSESVVIETINHQYQIFADRHYYQYSYMTYSGNIDVNSWTGTLTAQEQADRNDVTAMFDNAGENPQGYIDKVEKIITRPTNIYSTCAIAQIYGSGAVNRIFIKMSDATNVELTGLNLQVFYDGQNFPDVNIPVAYFFGAGESRADFNSLPIGVDSNEGFYCYWPMPFREQIFMQLSNTTDAPIRINGAMVEYEQKPFDHHTCYFKAMEKYTEKNGHIYHNILSTSGTGHYIGDLLYIAQDVNSLYMLEGDDVIYADGKLVQHGTGIEDAYNGGAYYNWVAVMLDEPEGPYPQSATRPLSGVLYVNKGVISRADQYRWRIADCIPFTDSIDVNIECRYGVNGSRWRSVGFWYELPHYLADMNEDGIVDSLDYAEFASYLGQTECGVCNFADFTGDGNVDLQDLHSLAADWMKQK